MAVFLGKASCKRFILRDRNGMKSHVFFSLNTGVSLIGCLLFIFAGSISEWYFKSDITTNRPAEFYALILGIIGFVLMQSALMLSSDILTDLLTESHKSDSQFELWIFRWKSIGRVAGYILASLDIFQTYTLRVYYVIPNQTVGDNLTFSYAFWMILQLFLLCALLPVISSIDMSKLKPDECLIPPWTLIWRMPIKIKALVLSYFFAYGNFVIISIYATSWTNITLFANSAHGAKFVIRRREFDLGVSWGALDMLILSLASFGFSICYSFVPNEKSSWITGNLLACIALVLSLYYKDDSLTFGFLPLCSCLFTCIYIAPFRIFSHFDKKNIKICMVSDFPHCGEECKEEDSVFHIPPGLVMVWEGILAFVREVSKFMALCFVPVAFMAFDRFGDSRWAMEISAYWGVLSFIFSLFI